MAKKYIFENGVMMLNPEFQREQAQQHQGSTIAKPAQALAIVSSTADITAANQVQNEKNRTMALAGSTMASMDIVQDESFTEKFGVVGGVDGNDVLDKLSNVFAKYEVPIGLLNKLLALTEYELNFIIDDSGSMGEITDSFLEQGCEATRVKHDRDGNFAKKNMTRWQEVEDRLYLMAEILAYIPTDKITISFLNRNDKVELTRGKTPEAFYADAKEKISALFIKPPAGRTPIKAKLTKDFSSFRNPTMHYLFTDGEPSDATTDEIALLVRDRPNPKNNPLTFASCTNEDGQADWMKEVDELADFTAEVDDFNDEKKEVLNDQGPAFPYSKGMWLLCQLVAAINPHDLDGIDESFPFTKMTLDNLLGRKLTTQEYHHYFSLNPNAGKYRHLENQFAREDIAAHQIPEVAQEIARLKAQKGQKMGNTYAPAYQGNGYPGNQPSNSGYPQVPQHNRY